MSGYLVATAIHDALPYTVFQNLSHVRLPHPVYIYIKDPSTQDWPGGDPPPPKSGYESKNLRMSVPFSLSNTALMDQQSIRNDSGANFTLRKVLFFFLREFFFFEIFLTHKKASLFTLRTHESDVAIFFLKFASNLKNPEIHENWIFKDFGWSEFFSEKIFF